MKDFVEVFLGATKKKLLNEPTVEVKRVNGTSTLKSQEDIRGGIADSSLTRDGLISTIDRLLSDPDNRGVDPAACVILMAFPRPDMASGNTVVYAANCSVADADPDAVRSLHNVILKEDDGILAMMKKRM